MRAHRSVDFARILCQTKRGEHALCAAGDELADCPGEAPQIRHVAEVVKSVRQFERFQRARTFCKPFDGVNAKQVKTIIGERIALAAPTLKQNGASKLKIDGGLTCLSMESKKGPAKPARPSTKRWGANRKKFAGVSFMKLKEHYAQPAWNGEVEFTLRE